MEGGRGLLFRPKIAPYIDSNVHFGKYSDMFHCIYIVSFIISLTYLNLK